MSKATRINLIKQLERERQSRLITYVTSTRGNLEVQMAMDAARFVYDHLEAIAASKKARPRVDLFLNSNGGDGTVPWRLVSLIREFASHFSVLVPYRAFSAATLTALGADEIVMHPMGMLGPTDPTVTNPFNPPDPTNPSARLGISVEDVTAYLALVKEDAGIKHEDQVVAAFNVLADKVHPLALGNVKRSLSQSRMMASKLLRMHMVSADHTHRVETIVDNLTSKLYFHGHPINRVEARELGLMTVKDPTEAVKRAMWKLYLEYEQEMLMNEPFDMATEFLVEHPGLAVGANAVTTKKVAKLAYIESTGGTDLCSMEYELAGQKLPNYATSVTLIATKRGWGKE